MRSHSRLMRATTLVSFLDGGKAADARQPAALADPLVQHRRVHHQQRCDRTAVSLILACVLLQVVQPEMRRPAQARVRRRADGKRPP